MIPRSIRTQRPSVLGFRFLLWEARRPVGVRHMYLRPRARVAVFIRVPPVHAEKGEPSIIAEGAKPRFSAEITKLSFLLLCSAA